MQPKMWPKAVNQCWKSRLEKRVNMEPITGGGKAENILLVGAV